MAFVLQPWQFYVVILAGWMNQQQQEVIEYLLTENRVLKEKHGGKRIMLNDDQRHRLAVKGKILGRKRLQEFGTLFTPDTILRWHRMLVAKKWDYSKKRKHVGRPRIRQVIGDLVLRFAKENPDWGYDRIKGALANVGYGWQPQAHYSVSRKRCDASGSVGPDDLQPRTGSGRSSARRGQATSRRTRKRREAATIRVEAESLDVTSLSNGAFQEVYPNPRASGEQYRMFMPKKPGDMISLRLRSYPAEKYEITTRLISQSDAADLQLVLNGVTVGTPIRVRGSTVSLGSMELSAGRHTLSFRLTSDYTPVKIRLDRIDFAAG